MQNALLSALSGLRINQQYLDVIGNNLANASTPGFKSSRVSFVDMLGQTLRPASGPTPNAGGRNPFQIGTGAAIGSVDVRMVQGSLLNTGRSLDLGIQGEGFFLLSDGNQNYYTRVGTFDFDANNYLVDLHTGYRVLNGAREAIQIIRNNVIPAQASTSLALQGNLPAVVTGPLAEVLRTDTPYTDQRPAVVTSNAEPYTLTGGETLRIQIDFGAVQTIVLPPPAGATLTAQEIANAINAAPLAGATASVSGGAVVLTTNGSGPTRNILLDPTGTATSALFLASSIGSTIAGSRTTANAATEINNLGSNTRDYVSGDQIRISGMLPDGSALSGVFVYGTGTGQDGTTLGALVDKINSMFNAPTGGATAVLNSDGTISLTANETGAASLSISLQDNVDNTGSSNWSSHFFNTVVAGSDPDQETVVSTVYDSTGQPHSVTLLFERQENGSWNVTPSVDPLEGRILSDTIQGLGFDSRGILSQVPPSAIQIEWVDSMSVQEINLDFGSAGQTDGLTMVGVPPSVRGKADGYTAGTLSSVNVRSDGMIEGFYTNSQILELDQLGLALFDNPAGLSQMGNGLWQFSSNSGEPFITSAQDGSAGSITAGSLEGSNVAIAEEFVRLIEAQRGFQANARIISTTDEILAELVNII